MGGVHPAQSEHPSCIDAVRIVFASAPAFGHVNPMLALARAFVDGDDDVVMATSPEMGARADAAGIHAVQAGSNMSVWWAELTRRTGGAPGDGLPVDRILPYFIPRLFAEVGSQQQIDDLVRWVRGADLVIFDTFAFAGPLAAAVAGVPAVHHLLGPPPPLEAMVLAGDAVAPLWRKWQLEPRPYGGTYAALTLTICPPILGLTDVPQGSQIATLRPVMFDAGKGEALPAWMHDLPRRPNVYMTLGTVTNTDVGVFVAACEGLAGEPVNLIITVGPANDPAALGPLPTNTHVERYIPQSLLLPLCDAVIHHGGSGTMLASLRAGLPQLIIPQGADQYINASVCREAGLADRLLPSDASPPAVRDRVRGMLQSEAMKTRAERARAEVEAMPDPAAVAESLREMARSHSLLRSMRHVDR